MQQHDTLLIAGGSRKSRNHLRSILQERFNLLEATNTRQMLLLLAQNLDCIASVILDISSMEGIDKDLQSDEEGIALLKQLPVIVIADKESYRDLTLYFRYGASDVLPLNYDPYAMLRRITTITQLSLHRKHLENLIQEQQDKLRHVTDDMVDALSTIIEYRSMESGHHILRIRNFTRILLEEVMHHCPEYRLDERLVSIISSASALHDVGKISIPDAILHKPGKLTEEEWAIMESHSVLGCDILNSLGTTVDREYMKYAYNICRYHHERWDGRGYPDGLKGDEIPICAQIVGLTDCYDALTNPRVYKEAYSHSRATNMILGGECGAFSEKLLECFKNVTGQFAQLSLEYADGRDPAEAIADMALPAPAEQEHPDNLVEKTRAKYNALIHYLNAFLVEIQLDTGLFQVIYNPYPDLAPIQGAQTLRELTDIVACQVVIPEEQERMYQVIWEEIPKFIDQDLRRQSFQFHHRPYGDEPGGPFEMTFLRIGGLVRRPSLAILCRKTDMPQVCSLRENDLLDQLGECTYICRNDSRFTLVKAGRDTHSLGGYTPKEVMDIFGGRLLDMAYPEDQENIRREFDRQLQSGTMVRTEYRFICKDGSTGWVVNKSQLVLGTDGKEYLKTFLFDITASKAAYSALEETLKRYQVILAQTENVLFDLDVLSNTIAFSDTWENIFGYKPSNATLNVQLAGETHVHPDDIPLLLDRLGLMARSSDYETAEIRIATVKGRYLWCRVRASASRNQNGKLIRVQGVILNINSEKQAQQALEDKASRDALTQLLNKNAGKQQIEHYLAAYDHPPACALILLDLDNFKEVNDRYGHLFGDALLTQVSRILSSLFHSQDILARIGGDEFMVLVRGVTDRELLASQCRRLRDLLLHDFRSETLELQLGCSIGIALCPEQSSNYYDLFAKADHALYQAKARGKNDFCFYNSADSLDYRGASHPTTPIDSDVAPGIAQSDMAYHLFRTLYQAEDISLAIDNVLAMMGKQAKVSRVYIFENSEDNTYCSNTFEWCNVGISPEKPNLQHVSYETDIPNYQDNFNDDGVFYCHDVRELPQAAYDVVAPQGIKSMLQCIIRHNGQFRGYIGFDECVSQRMWTKDEIRVLTYFSEILSMFLMQHREREKSQQEIRSLQGRILRQIPASYLLDPETYEIRQADESYSQLAGLIQKGTLCYRAIMGRDTPCEGCPAAAMGADQSPWALVRSQQGKQVLVRAVQEHWQGQLLCRMTCHPLPEEG